MSLLNRVKIRIRGEPDADNTAFLKQLCELAETRICLRIREETLPPVMEPIAADVVVKLWRRCSYEGISSEGADKISTTFFEDILAEYAQEFDAYAAMQSEENGGRRVHFL